MIRHVAGRPFTYTTFTVTDDDEDDDEDDEAVEPTAAGGLAVLFAYLGLRGPTVVVDPLRAASPTVAAACHTAGLGHIACSHRQPRDASAAHSLPPTHAIIPHGRQRDGDDQGGPLLPSPCVLQLAPQPEWLVVLAHDTLVAAQAVDLYLPLVSGGLIVQADDHVTDLAPHQLPHALQLHLPDATVTTVDCGTHDQTQVWLVWARDPALLARMAVCVRLF